MLPDLHSDVQSNALLCTQGFTNHFYTLTRYYIQPLEKPEDVHTHLVPDEHCFVGVLIGAGATGHRLNTTHPTGSHLVEGNQ